MSTKNWIGIAAGLVVAAALLAATALFNRSEPLVTDGVVLVDSPHAAEQAPIAGVRVSAQAGGLSSVAVSNENGFFTLTLPAGTRRGDPLTLAFYHRDYRPLEIKAVAGALPIARMTALAPKRQPKSSKATAVSNVRVRYSIAERNMVNVGTGVKMFETPNRGNMPCNGHEPCSPDGKWKAGIGGASLDAGADNRFRNARVSCIAGPCAFTRIDSDQFSNGGQRIGVTVRDWSDTATFVLQAEVVRVELSDVVRYVYPVVLDDSMNFTLPAMSAGPSIEAEIAGTPIVFPLGPRLQLSWAACEARVDKDQSRLYRCELKPDYQFR